MSEDRIVVALESLSEALVFAEPGDAESFREVQQGLATLAEWGGQSQHPRVARCAGNAQRLAELLGEGSEPGNAMEALSEAVSAFQRVVRDGCPEHEVVFPELLFPVMTFGSEKGGASVQAEEAVAESGALGGPAAAVDEDIFNDFLQQQNSVMEEYEEHVLCLEKGSDPESMAALRRLVHTLKGDSALVGLLDVSELCHAIEDALDAGPVASLGDLLLEAKDWLAQRFRACAGAEQSPVSPRALMERLRSTGAAASGDAVSPEQPGASDVCAQLVDALDSADEGDLQALSGIHTLFEQVGAAAESRGCDHLCEAARTATGLIEAIILGECGNPAQALGALRDDVPRMRSVLVEGSEDEATSYAIGGGLEAAPIESSETTLAEPAAPVALSEGDQELLADFVAEAQEHLDTSDLHLLTLEEDASNEDALNAVFRAFHTIKGVAGFLALKDVQRLAHEAETLLDKARKGGLELKGVAIDVTFDAVDALKALVKRVEEALAGDGMLMPDENLAPLLDRLGEASTGALSVSAGVPAGAGRGKRVGDILVEEGLASRENVEKALETRADDAEARLLGKVLVREAMASSKEVEKALALQQQAGETRSLGAILVDEKVVSAADLSRALELQDVPGQEGRVGATLVKSGVTEAKAVVKAMRAQKAGSEQQETQRESLKVDATRLDQLVNMVGELVIAESMVSQSSELRQKAGQELVRHIGQLDKITRELQEMGLNLRMVPIRPVFQKIARLVRDLSKQTGRR
jgi:chemotaxis protein histidine kinase CheA